MAVCAVATAILMAQPAVADPLRDAIRQNSVSGVERALRSKPPLEPACPANLNCKPLGYAAFLGNIEIVRLLLDAGADPDGLGPYGDVPIFKAYNAKKLSGKSDQEISEIHTLLLQRGANPNIPNVFAFTPFMAFCMSGDRKNMELARQLGGEVNGAYRSNLNNQRQFTRTVLIETIRQKRVDSVEWLLKHGADPNFQTPEGDTALKMAVKMGLTEIEAILRSAGATR
jgi:ankyrin repeat protein